MMPTIPKLATLRRSPILPVIVLLLTLSSVFIFSNERGHFYRYGPHGLISGNIMAIIANISLEDRFLGYYHERLISDDGETYYLLYNRFPLGGFVLTKLATLPFGGSLSAQLYAAQATMLLFYAAAALMAYLALSRLTRNPWIALAAVLLAFSSYYLLYFSDMVCTESSPSLFGVMLAFHGMVVFTQERRFPQLLLKSCAALLLGWHVYALLLPFIIFGVSAELIAALRSPGAASLTPSLLSRARRLPYALFRSRYLLLGVATLAFGIALLTFNFANEYRALDGKTSITELPSYTSMIRRGTGDRNDAFEDILGAPLSEIWTYSRVIEQQFHRIGVISAPYALPGYESARDIEFRQRWVITGIVVFAACVIGLAFTRRKMLWATLALYGFFWALPMRYQVVFHEFESMQYIGIPLTLFAFALMWISRQSNDRLIMLAAAIAVFVFAFSASQIARIGAHPDDQARHAQALADFDAIRPLTEDKIVYVPPPFKDPKAIGGRFAEDFYLAGRVIVIDGNPTDRADLVVSATRLPATETLTPHNRVAFLYRQSDYARWYQAALADAAGPFIRENFNVFMRQNTILFGKQDCSEEEFESRFILHIFPSDPADLPYARRQHGFENLDFRFDRRGIRLDDKCLASIDLPSYPIDRIRAGEKPPGGAILWQANIPLALITHVAETSLHNQADFAHWYQAALADATGPLARENFHIYIRENAILFGKQHCSEEDFKARLILHIIPTDPAHLPAARRQNGFENLDFHFDRRGIRLDGKCLASIDLPAYPIATIRAGQKTPDGNILWQTDLPFAPTTGGAPASFDLHQFLAQPGDPVAQSDFNIYLRDNLILYHKPNCRLEDTEPRFLLHIFPSDPADLPDARKQSGFANLDFNFTDNGAWSPRGCAALAQLPAYPIDRIRAGQHTAGNVLWRVEFAPALGP